jgi:hypothetical protein
VPCSVRPRWNWASISAGSASFHLRNAPPNPANYAQRAGRAGRSGQGALIFTYCSSYAPHDRHYFKEQEALVAGAVMAPRLDLCNRELLASHLNALAISLLGLPGLEGGNGLSPSIMRLVVDDNDKMPLASEVRAGLAIAPTQFSELKATFRRVIKDFEPQLARRLRAGTPTSGSNRILPRSPITWMTPWFAGGGYTDPRAPSSPAPPSRLKAAPSAWAATNTASTSATRTRPRVSSICCATI